MHQSISTTVTKENIKCKGMWLARLVIVDGKVSNTCTSCVCVTGKVGRTVMWFARSVIQA